MSLTKEITNDKIEVVYLEAGYPVIQVRTATVIKEDGKAISRNLHRVSYVPADSLEDVSSDVQALAGLVFTEEAKQAYTHFLESKDKF